MSALTQTNREKVSKTKLLSGSLLVAGTSIGAGMLGIPMVTSHAGFLPACFITVAVWLFMLITGLLFLEATLRMPKGANILSITQHYLGSKGKIAAGGMFAFLYYCLIVAYIAGGAPLFMSFFPSQWVSGVSQEGLFSLFTLMIALVVFKGARWIDKTNVLLSLGMFAAYLIMILVGIPSVSMQNLTTAHYSKIAVAVPVLFGAFGYHNVIPSLSDYLERDRKVLKLSLVLGTLIALVIYLMWQYLIIGAVSEQALSRALGSGQTSVAALQDVAKTPSLFFFGRIFAVLALVTSLLGVSLSMVDFFADGLQMLKVKANRMIVCMLTFVPPLVFTILNPTIFTKALGIAGGFGEAFLNGILPITLVWSSRYVLRDAGEWNNERREKLSLAFLFVLAFVVVVIELNEVFSFI